MDNQCMMHAIGAIFQCVGWFGFFGSRLFLQGTARKIAEKCFTWSMVLLGINVICSASCGCKCALTCGLTLGIWTIMTIWSQAQPERTTWKTA